MKKFLIAYSSRTGNTKKVAEALYSVAENRCVLAQSKDVGNLDEYPLVFVGYWVDKGRPDKDTQDFLRRLENKKIILFQTLGAEPFSDHALGCFANAGRYIHESCHVLGGISIRGAIDPNLIARFSKLPDGSPHAPNEERKKRWQEASAHPDKEDLERAADSMKKFIEMYDKFYSKSV